MGLVRFHAPAEQRGSLFSVATIDPACNYIRSGNLY